MDCSIGMAGQQETCSLVTVLMESKCCHVNAAESPLLFVVLL